MNKYFMGICIDAGACAAILNERQLCVYANTLADRSTEQDPVEYLNRVEQCIKNEFGPYLHVTYYDVMNAETLDTVEPCTQFQLLISTDTTYFSTAEH